MGFNMTIDLYDTNDIKRIREFLIKEQNGLCAITGMPLEKPVLEHRHDDNQFVRGVANSAPNVALGKIEGLNARYVSYWYPKGLPAFLRACADYLELPEDKRWRHLGWRAKILTKFNRLTAKKQDELLIQLGSTKGKNLVERKKLFSKAVMTRDFGYDMLRLMIKELA
jgi:hypothetical protein